MLVVKIEEVLDYSELIVEMVLLIDSNNEEDKKELERVDDVVSKGVLLRVVIFKNMVIRRGKKKLMIFRFVKISVDVVCNRF